MTSIFCCSNTHSYKTRTVSHEPKFLIFLTWANYPRKAASWPPMLLRPLQMFHSLQVIKQTNYGPLDGKRYFAATDDGAFVEVTEQWLVDANFQNLNTLKNFRCTAHNKFFEVNVHQKDPVNAHHWRANIARPAGDIDS